MRPPSFLHNPDYSPDHSNNHQTPVYDNQRSVSRGRGEAMTVGAGTYIPNYNQNLRNFNSRDRSSKSRDRKQEVYDRLSRSMKKFNPQMLDLQREREELRQCTFKPETNYRS